MKIRPNDIVHNNIRTIEPSLIKYTDSLYQFIIKVSAYTVLKYEYSELALYLNKAFNLPIGSITVEKLNKDETIKVEIPAQPKQYENEFNAEEEITEQDVIVESDPILEKKIDEQIENDNSIPMKVPEQFIKAMEEMAPIAKGLQMIL